MSNELKNIVTEAISELKQWVTGQLDDRFEKQEGKFSQLMDDRFEKQEGKFSQLMDDRFEKQEMMLTKYISQVKQEILEEVTTESKQHMEALTENVANEAGGVYRDELKFVKDKTENHEQRITTLEEKAR